MRKNSSLIQTHFDMLSSVGVLVGDFYRLLGNSYEVSNAPPTSYGRMRECYCNTFQLVEYHPQLTYCEGYAVSKTVPIPIHHAWAIDQDGRVLDPTWKVPGVEYFGLALKWDFVQNIVIENKAYGLLGEMVPRTMIEKPPTEYLESKWIPPDRQITQWQNLLQERFTDRGVAL